ncbi:ELKS/RAB6-INTERACTING/CAST FAMILY PROTEIN [Salix purpurea]|uniref:ELKS/RAB6-INTERACTING/CAST FAMILY PROTEIN n=1 Tax=Salix purpurea TaxID=77065 RepID=A0A9Q0SK16_SALPP|nr:ELKS/RAB6-INTERACTING/CAST FAMILY PROTEIN [Salix purpurea]
MSQRSLRCSPTESSIVNFKPQHTTSSSPSLSLCAPSCPKSQDIAVSQNSNIMGFKTVYKCLTDVFPQVDVRILKAVAIEHSKDADVAVEVVLSEIIPSLSRHSAVPSPPCEDTTPSLPSDGENEQEKESGLRRQQVSLVEGVTSEPRLVAKEDAKKTELISGLQGHIEGEELILLGKPQLQEDILQPGSSQTPRLMPACLGQENGELCGSWTESESHWKAFDGPENATYSVAEQTPDSAEDSHHSDFSGDSENMNSKQLGQIELLEENVEAAKDNKKTLFLEMESVMILMKEAELKEMAAEQAKDEAARGGLDILIKVEELKQMLVRAKEANGMHAGEVYGEKAILATEVRELQARLLSLSDEKDNALAILDEMRQTLKSRLAAAEELMKIAELEKLEKEEAAQNALTSCILASSGTSVKSLASDLGAEIGETSELPKEPVLACSADDVQSPELHHESVERASSDKKQLLDDEWDFV